MKANKSKLSEKAEKKSAQKVVKKELEVSITHKFLDALKGLGFDSEKLSKEVKKSSKELAKKITKKYSEVKLVVEEKLVKKPATIKIKKIKSPIADKSKPTLTPPKKAPVVKSKVVREKKTALVKSDAESSAKVNKTAPKRVANTASPVKTKASPASKVETNKPSQKAKKTAPVSPKVPKLKE